VWAGIAQLRLKVEYVAQCQRTGEANNQRAGIFTFFTIYLQRTVDGHIEKSIKKKAAGVDEFYVNVAEVTEESYRAPLSYLFKALPQNRFPRDF